MTPNITFTVPGPPQGKGRHRTRVVQVRNGKSFATQYADQKTKDYEGLIRGLALRAMRECRVFDALQCPVRLEIMATFEVPKSWPKWKLEAAIDGRISPTTKPDIDNVAKAICDGLNGVAWIDDAQVVSISVWKVYGNDPGIKVEIVPINDLSCAHIKTKSELTERE